MILAYHRVSSNRVLDAILEAGQIVPAVFRLHPDRITALCDELIEQYLGPTAQALTELIEEVLAYFASVRTGSGTSETALKCEDILAGDSGRIFLSPGQWSEAGRGMGWPLSGFSFDAEQLIQNGAAYRPDDIGSMYKGVIYRVALMQLDSAEEVKEEILEGFRKILEKGQLFGNEALRDLEIYRLQQGEETLPPYERRKRNWHTRDEIVWDGPLSLDWAMEIWRDDKIVESKLIPS